MPNGLNVKKTGMKAKKHKIGLTAKKRGGCTSSRGHG